MLGHWHKDSVFLSTTLVLVLSLRSPRTQAPDIAVEATYHPSRLYVGVDSPSEAHLLCFLFVLVEGSEGGS